MKIQPVGHLVAAVLTGDRERLERLIGRDPGLGHQRNMFGVSPIHATARSGPHQGEVPAETARSQGHLVLASQLDPDGADG
jgi:hypothetical protein